MEQSEISEALAQDSAPQSEPDKKRRWAGWTREEEEMFFFALREVGKNFENITSHVKTKNKNQVRHYYYRLIKRMNKLIHPELVLDARNWKDVNSAMLYWWSLLEKYKCSYSKLHVKPRRLKAFVAALELQIRKDRRKSIKRSAKLSETAEASTPVVFPVQGRRKPRSSKRKPKETGAIPHLVEASRLDLLAGTTEPSSALVVNPNLALDPVYIQLNNGNDVGIFRSLELFPSGNPPAAGCSASDMQEKTALKFKLQLFPLDDATKVALEQDGHNPHLELTLKGTKSISSVLHHLKQKWGRSKAASGELRLFPYAAQEPATTSWGLKDTCSASDVHTAIGSPSVFRLKYGWTTEGAGLTDEQQDGEELQENNSPVVVDEPTDKRELQDAGCSWLYDQSTDGFGQRLWQDEDQLHATSSAHGMDWIRRLTAISKSEHSGTASALVGNEQQNRHAVASTSSIWGGDEACDAFSFKHKEQICQVPSRPVAIKEPERELPEALLLGSDSQGAPNLDILRCSSLDLYWADSLGMDGTFGALGGSTALLSGNSTLGASISGSIFADSLDGFLPPKNSQ